MSTPPAAQSTTSPRPQHWWSRVRRLGVPPKRVVIWSMVSSGPMAAIVIAGAILSYHGHALLVESRLRVDHSYQVLSGLNKLFVSIEDAETGQRGFIITGRDAYLDPYVEALKQTDGHLHALRELLQSDAGQAARLSTLQGLIDAKLGELGMVIQLRRREGFESASNAILQGQGKQLMDEVRAEVGAISGREEAQLRQQQDDARQRERELLRLGVIVAAASLLVRFGVAFLLARLRARQAAQP